jgi:hypothetical protein
VEKELEKLIDQHGIAGVLQTLVDICEVRAEHARNEKVAERWSAIASKIAELEDIDDLQ